MFAARITDFAAEGQTLHAAALSLVAACVAIGLLTPVFSLPAAVVEMAWMIPHHAEAWRYSVMNAGILVALTVLGPGAYSIDRWIFGRKRLTIGRLPR